MADNDQEDGVSTSEATARPKSKLKPIIAKTFPFEKIVDAHKFMESNEQIGKIIVTVG